MWVHCVNPVQAAAKVRLHAWLSFFFVCLLVCFVFWKRFKFKFPLIFESVANIQIIFVIISLICQQMLEK